MDEGIQKIGQFAFYKCSGLVSASIPNSVTSLGFCAFCECEHLSNVVIPNKLTSIGESAFNGCKSFTSVDIPDSVVSIESGAFSGCEKLTTITIPSNVINIGNYSFSNCTSVKTVSLPSAITSIGWQAFFRCSALTDVYYSGTPRMKSEIAVGSDNSCLLDATWHYLPDIITHPKSITVNEGDTATFAVTAEGEGLTYQWEYQKPGESTWNDVMDNGQSAIFNQTNVASRHDGFKFRCKVSNSAGSVISNAAVLTVGSSSQSTAPTITTQPSSVTTALGTTATFTVTAEGEGLTYQWQYQRPGESTWNDAINNGQSATFNQTNVETRHNGFKFRCKVSNSAGSVISNAAMLTVH